MREYIIRDGKVIQMSSAIGCIAFEGTQKECEDYVEKNGVLYKPWLCPLCNKHPESGLRVSNANGKGQVCFGCRNL